MRTGPVLALVAALLAAPLAGCLDKKTEETPGPAPATLPGDPCTATPGAAKDLGFTAARPRATLTLKGLGDVVVELYREEAPLTVGNFVNLTEKGVYAGTTFHRVIGTTKAPPNGFMMQGGDPNSKDSNPGNDGQGGPGYDIPDEFNAKLRHDEAGTLSMANAGPNSGGSQFFITFAPTPWLDDKHAVFGRVVGGKDIVDEVKSVPTDANDRPKTPIVLEKVTIDAAGSSVKAERKVSAHAIIAKKATEVSRAVTYMVVVENGGNTRDVIALGATAPQGWRCALEHGQVLVPAGSARVVLVTLVPPGLVREGDATATVKAWSVSDPSKTAEVPLTATIKSLGAEAKAGSKVTGNYVGVLEDGRLFDTSVAAVAKDPRMGKSAFWGEDAQHSFSTFQFTVGSGVIEGFSELATGAKEGETKAGRIPAAKAYGERGGDLSGKTLLFDLEIVKVG